MSARPSVPPPTPPPSDPSPSDPRLSRISRESLRESIVAFQREVKARMPWPLRVAIQHGVVPVSILATFAAAAIGGVVLHANLPPIRRLARSITNDATANVFAGRLLIGEIERLDLGRRGHVVVKKAEIYDPEQKLVIGATGIEGSIDLVALLRSLTSNRPPHIDIDLAAIDEAEVVLDKDAQGSLAIVRAFKPKHPSAPSTKPKVGLADDDPVILHIDDARVRHATVRGNLVPPELDGTADDVRAKLSLEKRTFHLAILTAKTTLRAPKIVDQTAPVVGDATGELDVALGAATASLKGHADLRGSAGEVPVTAHAGIDGELLSMTVDVPETDAAAIARLFPSVRLTKPASLHASAIGKFPTVILEAQAKAGDADVIAKGEIDTREGNAFRLEAEAKNIDGSLVGSVATKFDGHIRAEGILSGPAAPLGTFKVTTSRGTIAAEPIPPAIVAGRFEGKRITATVQTRDPQAISGDGYDVLSKLDLDLSTRILDFDVQARSDSLPKIARARGVVTSGTASARARGKLDLNDTTIQAQVTANGSGIASGPLSADQLQATATLSGPVTNPRIDVRTTGTNVRVTAKDKEPLVYARASAQANVSLSPTPRLGAVVVHVGEEGTREAVTARADSVTIKGGVVDAQGLRVEGIGKPIVAEARIAGGNVRVRVKSEGVDTRRLSLLTGIAALDALPRGTHAALDVDLTADASTVDGHADVTLEGPNGIGAEAHVRADRGHIVGTARAALEKLGYVDLSSIDVTVPNGLSRPSLERATGTVEARGAIDLAALANLFTSDEHLALEKLGGVATIEARAERRDASVLPVVRGTIKTRDFEAIFARIDEATGIKTQTIRGVDGSVHFAWDGETDDAEIGAVTWDDAGVLASADAKAKLPLFDYLTKKRTFDANTLPTLDTSAVFDFAARDVATFPAFFRPEGLSGVVELHSSLDGVLAHPRVVLAGRARRIREIRRRNEQVYEPLDASVDAQWDGERLVATIAADERARRPIARVTARGPRATGPSAPSFDPEYEIGEGPPPPNTKPSLPGAVRGLVIANVAARDLLAGRFADLPWTGSAEVAVSNLKLAPIPLPRGDENPREGRPPPPPLHLDGALTGRIRIRDLNAQSSLEVNGAIQGFGVQGVVVDNVDLTVGARDASVFASARVRTGTSTTTIQLASKALTWSGLQVGWNADEPTRLDYVVQSLPLTLFRPLVRNVVPEMEGRIDGTGYASFDSKGQTFEGGLAVTQGRLYVTTLGEEVTNLTATARFDRSGVFRIENATGTVGAGEFRATATGKMKGLAFESGEATIVVPGKEGVPLSSQGATFAEAIGEVKIAARMADEPNTLLLTVDVPRAEIELPDRSTASLQSLDPDTTIAVGIRQKDGTLAPADADRRYRVRQPRRPADPSKTISAGPPASRSALPVVTTVTPSPASTAPATTGATGTTDAKATFTTRIALNLGDQVTIEGRGMSITLGGKTLVEVADEIRITGRIDLRGGSAEVYGRRFTIDRGTINFLEGEDFDNPTIVAAAYWDSPDRTRVWVEFSGPLKAKGSNAAEPKLTLRSEPPYSNTEILSVLLFGRPDPNQASAASGGGSRDSSGATVVTTGFVAGDVNKLLSKLDEDLDYETDTLSGNRARQKIGHSFFNRRLKVQVGYAPTPTFREPDTTFAFLTWHFIPKWSVQGTVGNKGTSILDVLFQHRY